MFSRLRELLTPAHGTDAHPLDDDTMLKYFLSQLEVRVKLLAPLIAGDMQKEALLNDARNRLEQFNERHKRACSNLADNSWNDAYCIERMLALVEPAGTLLGEVQRRLDEAADEKVGSAARFRTMFDAVVPLAVDNSTAPPALRAHSEKS
jgi:hypothetical protein